MDQFVVQFSGGIGSWLAARRLADEHGPEALTLLFADTLIEDEDLYRFLKDAAADIGARFVRVADGRNPWQVFRDERYIGNSWIDPCSKKLKRELLRKWVEDHCEPETHVIAFGIDWTELHRLERTIPRWKPYRVVAPLTERPYLDKRDALALLKSRGLTPPELYELGFPHNNCGGFCVKAGQAQFRLLYRTMPERYLWHEEQERRTAEYIGKPVTILSRQVDGKKTPLSLHQLRLEIEDDRQQSLDADDWGGCGCALD